MSIPFRSIRFHPANEQVWGVTLMRYIARNDEYDYWPRVSSTISGRLNQEALITGVEGVSPGRNMQFNPYGYLSGLRALDDRDPIQPRFDNRNLQGKLGLDSKFVFHDSLVLDTTINPDFAQIETDQPQNTVNQRFEVFFPEKRPFFLENSNFFSDTNIGVYQLSRILFTRRIIEPSFGTRLTGKQGPWNLGFFVADDRSPGLDSSRQQPFERNSRLFRGGPGQSRYWRPEQHWGRLCGPRIPGELQSCRWSRCQFPAGEELDFLVSQPGFFHLCNQRRCFCRKYFQRCRQHDRSSLRSATPSGKTTKRCSMGLVGDSPTN